jgi:hypothetical protein
MENAYPMGKHVGNKLLQETDIDCVADTVPGWLCVKAYSYWVHSTGIANELRVQSHSHKGVFLVCNVEETQCDIVALGGHANFGFMHARYKEELCQLPGDPPITGQTALHQPPYRVVGDYTRGRANFFWSSNHNRATFGYYAPVPNRLLQSAWIESGVWSSPARSNPACASPTGDVVHEGNNQTQFQVFSFRFKIGNLPRPFTGFTDVNGNVDATCTEMGPNCVPLHVGADVPAGDVYLNRSVIAGDPAAAPIQTFPCPDCVMPAHP